MNLSRKRTRGRDMARSVECMSTRRMFCIHTGGQGHPESNPRLCFQTGLWVCTTPLNPVLPARQELDQQSYDSSLTHWHPFLLWFTFI